MATRIETTNLTADELKQAVQDWYRKRYEVNDDTPMEVNITHVEVSPGGKFKYYATIVRVT